MKFQNSSIHGFKVMLCIKKRDERTDGRKDGRTNNPEAICPSNFFEVGGIKTMSLSQRALPSGKRCKRKCCDLGLGRAAVCDCGTPLTFLLPFLF